MKTRQWNALTLSKRTQRFMHLQKIVLNSHRIIMIFVWNFLDTTAPVPYGWNNFVKGASERAAALQAKEVLTSNTPRSSVSHQTIKITGSSVSIELDDFRVFLQGFEVTSWRCRDILNVFDRYFLTFVQEWLPCAQKGPFNVEAWLIFCSIHW